MSGGGVPAGGDSVLRVYGFLPLTYANGPGRRAGLWLQGCARRCPGCFNSAAWDPTGGRIVRVDVLARRLRGLAVGRGGRAIEGLSVSGGEPLRQMEGLLALLRLVRRETALSVLVFTGYPFDEAARLAGAEEFLRLVDVLVCGPYLCGQHLGTGLLGSANQTVHLLTERYTLNDINDVPQAEVVIRTDGRVVLSGIEGEPLGRALIDGDIFHGPDVPAP